MRQIKEDVNKKHSYTWTKINDDARHKRYREEFLKLFGGNFADINTGCVEWREEKEEKTPPTRTISIINPDGEVVEVENFTKYCRENDLTRSAMYEVLKGKRKQHKGFKAKETDK